jgi:hypothetical protein
MQAFGVRHLLSVNFSHFPSFGSFGQAVSEEKIFKNWPIRNKNCLWWPYLLMDRDKMSTIHRGAPIDASIHLKISNICIEITAFCMASTGNSCF